MVDKFDISLLRPLTEVDNQSDDTDLVRDFADSTGAYSIERGIRGVQQAFDAFKLGRNPNDANAAQYAALREKQKQEAAIAGAPKKALEDAYKTGGLKGVLSLAGPNIEALPSFLGEMLPASAMVIPVAGAAAIFAPEIAVGAIASTLVASAGVGTVSGLTEGYSQIFQDLSEKGVDIKNPEEVQKAFADPTIINPIKDNALNRGLSVGAWDALGAGIAGRFLSKGMDFATAVKSYGKEIGTQATTGMAGETTAQANTGGIDDTFAIFAEGLGEAVTGAPEAILGAKRIGSKEKPTDTLDGVEATPVEPTGPETPPAPSNAEIPNPNPYEEPVEPVEETPAAKPAEKKAEANPISEAQEFLAKRKAAKEAQPKPTIDSPLPSVFKDIKPTYKGVKLGFERPLDSVLYSLANANTKSKRDAEMMNIAKERTGLSEEEIRSLGKYIKNEIGNNAPANSKSYVVKAMDAVTNRIEANKQKAEVAQTKVDQTAKTQRVYHGTSKDQNFKKFKDNGRGVFVTTNPDDASEYAVQNDSQGYDYYDKRETNTASRVIPLDIDIKNPYKVEGDELKKYQMQPNYRKTQKEVAARAKAAGHDAVDWGGGVFQILEPQKLKSPFNANPSADSNFQEAASQEMSIPPVYNEVAPTVHEIPLTSDKSVRYQSVINKVKQAVKDIAGSKIKVEPAAMLMGETTEGKGQFLRGAQFDDSVFIAMETNDALGLDAVETAYHEGWHYLRETAQVFSDKDIKLLEQAAPELRARYAEHNGFVPEDMDYFTGPEGAKEMEAAMFGLWSTGQIKYVGKASPVFNKIKQFFTRLRNAVNGSGFRTVDDLFNSVKQGDYANTAGQAREQATQARFQRLVSEISNIQQNKLFDTYKVEDLQKSVPPVKSVTQFEDFKDWMGSQYSKMESAPQLASQDSVFATMFNLYNAKEQSRLAFTKHFSGKFNDLKSQKKAFPQASKVLNMMVDSEQDVNFTPEGELLFKQDGKMFKTTKEVGAVAKGLQDLMKDVVTFYDRLLRNVLQEQKLPMDATVADVRTMQEFYNEKALEAGENRQLPLQTSYSRKAETFGIIADQLETIKKLQTSKKAWLPRVRFGKWATSVQRKNADGEWETVGLYTAEDSGKLTKASEKDMKDRLDADFPNKTGLKISSPFELTYNSMQNNIKDVGVSAELIAGLLSSDSPKSYEDILLGAAQTVKDRVRMRGFQKHFLERKNIKGYDQDWERSIAQYLTSATNGLTNLKFSNAEVDIEAAIPKLQGIGERKRKQYQNYIDTASNPSEDWAKIRTLNYMWAMGGNVSSALLQLITPVLNTPSYTLQWSSNFLGNTSKALLNTARAMKFINPTAMRKESSWKNFSKSNLFSKDEKEVIALGWDRGFAQAASAEDFLHGTESTRSTSQNIGAKIQNALGWGMQSMEHVSRISTILTIFNSLKSPKSIEKAMKAFSQDKNFAEFMRINSDMTPRQAITMFAVQELHAVYGQHARSTVENSKLAKLILPFTTFPSQQFELIVRMGKSRGTGGKYATTGLLVMYLTLAGALGFPGAEVIKAMYKAYKKVYKGDPSADLKLDMQKYLVDSGISPATSKAIMGGAISSLLGVEIGNRISPTMPYLDTAARWAQDPTLGGMSAVVGSAVSGIAQSVETLASGGSLVEAASKSLPVAGARNLIQAFEWNENGVKTAKGNKVISEDEITNKDVILKSLGFTSTHVSEKRDLAYAAQLKKTAGNTAKQRLAQQYSRLLYERRNPNTSPERQKEISDKLKDTRQNVVALARALAEAGNPIDEDWFQGFENSVKRQMTNFVDPSHEYRKSKRINYKDLENVYTPDSDDNDLAVSPDEEDTTP